MRGESSESEKLRIADDGWSRRQTVAPKPRAGGAAACVGRTITISGAPYPTAASKFYGMTTVALSGAEVEGGAGVLTAQGDTFFAFNLGSAIPPSGTNVICTFTEDWVFRYDG